MKKQFKLQKVLEHRERVAELEKNKLAEIRLKESQVKDTLAVVIENIDKKLSEQQEFRSKGDITFMRMYDNFINKLKQQKMQLEHALNEIGMQIKKQQDVVITSINNHKIMLKLKEKHDINYMKYLNKEELKMIDEVVVSRMGMNND